MELKIINIKFHCYVNFLIDIYFMHFVKFAIHFYIYFLTYHNIGEHDQMFFSVFSIENETKIFKLFVKCFKKCYFTIISK